jgi:hypothetical protein
MDLSTILTPGLQNLLSVMLGEGWSAARGTLARWLGRGDEGSTRAAEHELDAIRAEVRALAKTHEAAADAATDRRLLEAYVAGYLRRVREQHPDVDAVLASLPTVIHSSDQSTVATGSGMTQVFHGKVGSVLSIEQLDGGLTVNNS